MKENVRIRRDELQTVTYQGEVVLKHTGGAPLGAPYIRYESPKLGTTSANLTKLYLHRKLLTVSTFFN